jgi:glycosyltransferase involved in cell wall biosynthesis
LYGYLSAVTSIHVVHLITDLDVGGAEMMLLRLVAATDRERFRMSVVSMTALGPVGAELAALGINVQTLGMSRAVPDPRGLLRLVMILRREPADLLQTWLYHADLLGLLATALARVPRLAWNLRCSDMELGRYSLLSATLPRLLARLSKRPDAILVNSLAGKMVHERLGYRPRRWEVVPNGIDVERFRPDPDARARLRTELGLAAGDFVICLPARFDPMKDHATFLAAASRFARECDCARFLLVGRGTELHNPALDPLLDRSGCRDQILPLGERRDMPAIFAAADVACLSSRFGEGFPNVIAEAMACGVPVVSTDVGDAALIVGATGAIVPILDGDAMATEWRRLYSLGAESRAALGEAGRRRIVEAYALPAIVARYEALYEHLAAAR